MNRFILAALVSLAPGLALATEWKDVPLVNGDCEIGAHPRPEVDAAARAMGCAGTSYGILSDGTWLRLDRVGNWLAKKAVGAGAEPHDGRILVDVTGVRDGDVIEVRTLHIST